MKMNIKVLAAIAAFSAAAFAAHAQVATSFGDLVLGFKPATGTTNVEIKLGSISTFQSATGTLDLGNFNSVLSAAYGADWATNTTTGLAWGVVGSAGNTAVGDVAKTAWATSAWNTANAASLGAQNSTSFGSFSSSALGTTVTKVNSVYTSLTGATAGQTSGSAVTNTTGVWGTNAPFNLTGALFTNQVTSLALGQTYSAADLYRLAINTVPAGIMGTFALDQSGEVTFTVIPEPSTYAAILGLATLGFVAIRRRNQFAAQV